MARKREKRSSKDTYEEDFGLDEVDAFHAERGKIQLEEALPRRREYDENSDEEEEVMGIDDDSSSENEYGEGNDDEDEEDKELFGMKGSDEELDEESAWGGKRDYYGADDLEDEETSKKIEEEAIRQQKKHLQELNMDDYMDEEMEAEWTKSAKSQEFGDDSKTSSGEKPASLVQLDPKSKMSYLKTAHPEFIPLARELAKLEPLLKDLKAHKDLNEVYNVKFTALSAYIGSITVYLALFASFAKEDDPFSMKTHPIMESLLSSKELWRQASELENFDAEENNKPDVTEPSKKDKKASRLQTSDVESEDEVLSDSESNVSEADEDEELSTGDESVDIDIDISKPRVFKKPKPQISEDFVETEIADVDQEEKKARKRTLRFYTSKIDQQSKKNDERYTGDMDVPYKERLFERQQRLIEEARKRGQHDSNGADLDGNDSYDEQDINDANDVNTGFNDVFYETVKSSRLDKKESRKKAHSDAVRASKEGKLAQLQENIGENGKRAVNYQILKNKGLTPHRKKENRNARVKKRNKYDKAQKKLKSVRAVYSAPTGAYAGEKTGIKKNLSKSVKF